MFCFDFRDEKKCAGWADAKSTLMCPNEVGYNWRYAHPNGFQDAGKGLTVKCISETGTTEVSLSVQQLALASASFQPDRELVIRSHHAP